MWCIIGSVEGKKYCLKSFETSLYFYKFIIFSKVLFLTAQEDYQELLAHSSDVLCAVAFIYTCMYMCVCVYALFLLLEVNKWNKCFVLRDVFNCWICWNRWVGCFSHLEIWNNMNKGLQCLLDNGVFSIMRLWKVTF